MSNQILKQGFVSPFIQFIIGNQIIDTIPPRYFMSFHQERSVEKACSFELTLIYVPGNASESIADVMHQVLLTAKGQEVTYRYGYKTRSGVKYQDNMYTGIFTNYTEQLNDVYLTYVISGVASNVQDTQPKVCVSGFLNSLKQEGNKYMYQPSELVEKLVRGRGSEARNTGIYEYFRDFSINIKKEDEKIPIDNINVQDGALHDVFCGKRNSKGETLPVGFVALSYKEYKPQQDISNGLLSSRATAYSIANAYASSSLPANVHAEGKAAKDNLEKMPFVCFFDNVLDGGKKGSFNYLPKFGGEATKTYTYDFGNSVLESDVLSFNADFEGVKAIASINSLKNVTSDIDADGESIRSNYNAMLAEGFVIPSYNTPSGFNEAAFLSESVLADVLNYPFNATMTIIGETECSKLLDTIQVNVFVNGVPHPSLTGKYTILGIEDSLSDSGFTTTFKLVRDTKATSQDKYAQYQNNFYDGTNAQKNQDEYKSNDFTRTYD
jgi:hypothetical protein